MNFEKPADGRYELHQENSKRLAELMGEDYNSMEMEDYLSYLSPEQAKEEIDTFEEKLKNQKQAREQIISGFKAHLGYLAG